MKRISDLLVETQVKPELIELFTSAVKAVNLEDAMNDDLSIESIQEENETFYMRVVYLFLDYAGKYYHLHEIKDWLASEILESEKEKYDNR